VRARVVHDDRNSEKKFPNEKRISLLLMDVK